MSEATPLTIGAQERLSLWGPRLIVAVATAALVLVGLDVGGPLRNVTTALAVLVAPGLAASLAMGPMSVEARALVSVVASTALLTVVSMVMSLLGSSSPTTGLWVCALVAFALILVPFLRSDHRDPEASDASGASDSVNDSTVASPSPVRGDDQDEGGNDHDR